jgi:ketosteroid isomerase-like protein
MMAEPMETLAAQVRLALDAADLEAFEELLDPDVTWGAPDARRPTCRNRAQVLRWYQRGRESGVRAKVSDVVVVGQKLLVGLTVRGSESAQDGGGAAPRWQVLTVRNGRVVDIVGFDDRSEAVDRAGSPTV